MNPEHARPNKLSTIWKEGGRFSVPDGRCGDVIEAVPTNDPENPFILTVKFDGEEQKQEIGIFKVKKLE